ncbi:selenium binding protein [Lactococcus petauri]|uniref:selenium binding protein n=1 Tax=Lactococcus petauri TaxID=1940789 RepID=UPI00288CB367|nr:selenium binding protein [Lactococcus petauri]MDT2620905.1 selenium binding protein [Lactococcus petauri]
MYNDLTLQALPKQEYIELLGVSLYVFNSNNSFIIENILINQEDLNWYTLIDFTSGKIIEPAEKTILKKTKETDNEELGMKIINLFKELISKRNRIIHAFCITDQDSREQLLATKDKNNIQYPITIEYLQEFIKQNSILSSLLHEFRGK